MHRSATRTRRTLVLTASLALLAGVLFGPGSVAAGSPFIAVSGVSQASSATALKSTTGRLAKTEPSLLKATSSTTISVMVKLEIGRAHV